MLTDASGKPIATVTFVVCSKGHVNEAPSHPMMVFRAVDGAVEQVILCARCQFEFFANHCGGEELMAGTTRKEAEWKAKEMKNFPERGMRVVDNLGKTSS